MLHAIGGRGGGSLFATDDSQPPLGGSIFQPFDSDAVAESSPVITSGDAGDGTDGARKTPVQRAGKAPVAAAS